MTLPVVWIPGHLCGPWLYAPQFAVFGGERQTVIADIGQDDSLEAMAERLLADAPQRFVVAGLSMGGMVAMEVLARAAHRVAGAVLMDTDPSRAREKEKEWRAGLLAKGLEPYVETFVRQFFRHDAGVAERLGPLTRQMMAQTPAEVARAQARALDTRRDMVPLLAGYAGPVEVVVGAEDRVCPPVLHHALAEALPGATLTEIPRCGHVATLEAPHEVNARIAALLERSG